MCLRVNYEKKYEKRMIFLASFKYLKKGFGAGAGVGSGFGFIGQRSGSGHENVTDPQHL
jgi:hypothetical protein